MAQDPNKQKLLVLAGLLVLLLLVNRVVFRPAPAPSGPPQPALNPTLSSPVKRSGYTIMRIVTTGNKSVYHVQVAANASREQMASYAGDIKASYPATEVTSVQFFSGDVNDPKTAVGVYIGGRVAMPGEGLAPPGQ